MINKLLISAACTLLSVSAFAQKSDGTTKSLVAAERAFAETLSKEGAKKAYLQYTTPDAVVFRPNPVNARTFYAAQDDDKSISWKPVYAKISRSGDWGFTTGPYVVNADAKYYGQYLSLWTAKNDKWEVALDLGISHNKPLKPVTEQFVEPSGKYTPKQYSIKEQTVGLDIIMNTERTLNTTLKSYGAVAMAGFINGDARLLFPGNEPIIGKENIMAFNNRMIDKINLKTAGASKALGGELAYTTGVATIDYKADLRESFNYVFIWERQADANWNIIVQMFVPAER